MPALLNQPYIFVDVETSGGSMHKDRIIEVGLVEYEADQLVQWSSLVNPGLSVSKFIEKYTGISNHVLSTAPDFAEIAPYVHQKLQNKVIIGHGVYFDYNFLFSEFARLGIKLDVECLCTVSLSQKLYPKEIRHNLDALIQRHALPCVNRHRALDDALALVFYLKHLHAQFPQSTLDASIHEILHPWHNCPKGLQKTIQQIPTYFGVCQFQNQNKQNLHTQSSNNLRQTVIQNLKQSSLADEVCYIKHRSTEGKFSAKLLELEWQAQLPKPLHFISTQPDAQGYLTCFIDTITTVEPNAANQLLGLNQNKKHTKSTLRHLTKQFKLCPQLMGLTQNCKAYAKQQCRGACCAEETSESYNLRVEHALNKLKPKPWPFEGAVGIAEPGPDETRILVFEQWCFLGRLPTLNQEKKARPHFQWPIYQLLQNTFRHPHSFEILDLKQSWWQNNK